MAYKQPRVGAGGAGGLVGDSYCFVGIERSTKLIVAWHLGKRTAEDTDAFCSKLRQATGSRFQLSTDGYGPYQTAVPRFLGDTADYGILVKVFGNPSQDEQRKYSPAKIKSIQRQRFLGNPDPDKICTSHAERSNGSMRCFIKRMGRLTYCFSKLWENHEAAIALYFCHYNYCRVHRTLRMTPAMKSGLARHPWTARELILAV